MNKLSLTLAIGLLTAVGSILADVPATTGTINFTDFRHSPDINAPANYAGFTFANGWFENPEASITDRYLALSLDNNTRGTFVTRVDNSPFTLNSFDYWSRGGDNGVAYLVLYDGGTTVYNGVAATDQIKLTPAHETFQISSVYNAPITGFAFAFKQSGGGLGDNSDASRFGFDNLSYSNATLPLISPITVTPAVPEPHSVALMLGGLMLICARPKKNSTT